MKDELIDVLDGNGVKTGIVKSRDEVHKNGLWHRAIVVAIVNENNDYGWRFRFDYIMCSKVLKKILRRCYSPDLEYSDHLPVILEVK